MFKKRRLVSALVPDFWPRHEQVEQYSRTLPGAAYGQNNSQGGALEQVRIDEHCDAPMPMCP